MATIELDPATLGIALSIASFLFSIYVYTSGKAAKALEEAKKLEHRITKLETKIEPLVLIVEKAVTQLLIQKNTPELDALLRKVRDDGMTSLSKEELCELRLLLNSEFDKALEDKDGVEPKPGRGIGIALLQWRLNILESENGDKK